MLEELFGLLGSQLGQAQAGLRSQGWAGAQQAQQGGLVVGGGGGGGGGVEAAGGGSGFSSKLLFRNSPIFRETLKVDPPEPVFEPVFEPIVRKRRITFDD